MRTWSKGLNAHGIRPHAALFSVPGDETTEGSMHMLKSIVAVVLVSTIGITPSCSTMGGGRSGGMSGGGMSGGGGYLIEVPYELLVL